MNVDVVWATIAVAAVAGSSFYGLLALLERGFTFWHPSYRSNERKTVEISTDGRRLMRRMIGAIDRGSRGRAVSAPRQRPRMP